MATITSELFCELFNAGRFQNGHGQVLCAHPRGDTWHMSQRSDWFIFFILKVLYFTSISRRI